MTVIGEAFVKVKADTKGFADDAKGGVANAGASLGKVFGLAFSGAAVLKLGKDAFDEAQEARKVQAQTAAAIKSTGGSAKVTAVDIGKLADKLSVLTGQDDEAVQSAENLLLTFTNVKNEIGAGNDIFNQATATLLDMGTALHTDASGGAIQLGKALNDPTKGITALTRVGVTFTAQQKDQIKALQASGDILGAQKIILAELNKEFGGSAAAAATAEDKFSVTFKNIEEQLGTALLPVIDDVANGLSVLLPSAIDTATQVFKAAGDITLPIRTKLESFFDFAFDPQKGVLGKSNWDRGLEVIQGKLNDFLLGKHTADSALSQEVAKTFQVAPAQLGTPVSGEQGLLGITIQQTQHDAQVLAAADANASTLNKITAKVGNIISDAFGLDITLNASTQGAAISAGIAEIQARFSSGWERIRTDATNFWHVWGDDISTIVGGAFGVIQGVVEIAVGQITGTIRPIIDLLHGDFGKAWTDAVQGIKDTFGGLVDFLSGGATIIRGILGTVFQGVGAGLVGALNSVIGGFESALNLGVDLVNTALDLLDKAAGPFVNFGEVGHINLPRIGGAATGGTLTPIRGQFATGGITTGSGMFLVGEHGPEVVRLPAGATVIPTSQVVTPTPSTAAVAATTTSGSSFHIEQMIVPAPPDASPLEVASTISEHFAWRFGASAVPA